MVYKQEQSRLLSKLRIRDNRTMTDDLNNHERDKLIKLLRNAYIELCKAEKLLKGIDSKEEKNSYDSTNAIDGQED